MLHTTSNILHSNEASDIFSKASPWILRWGIIIIGFLIATILVFSFLIYYPDVVKSEIIIYSENPPIHLIAKQDGRIKNIFIRNNEEVIQGQVLIEFENLSDYNSMALLKEEINMMEQFIEDFSPHFFSSLKDNTKLKLGRLQRIYTDIHIKIDEYINFCTLNSCFDELNLLRQNIQNYECLSADISNCQKLKRIELEKLQMQYEYDSLLFCKKKIEDKVFAQSKQKVINGLLELNYLETDFSQVQILISNMQREYNSLIKNEINQKRNLEREIKYVFQKLVLNYEQWQSEYLLVAPINGKVLYSDILSRDKNTQLGDIVVTVLPESKMNFFGVIKMPVNQAGKVKIGNKVNIRISNFSYHEYGTLNGIVKYISEIPVNDFYNVYVDLPDSLLTSYNILLPFKHELYGSAEIIVAEKVLGERIIDPFRESVKYVNEGSN